MWPFKKNEQEERQKTVAEIYREVSAVNVFEGIDNPWRIVPYEYDNGVQGYKIRVFRLDESRWDSLCSSSYSVIGVKSDEYSRIMKELFKARIIVFSTTYKEAIFETKEQAQKVIDEFAPYYDSYHTPKAIMKRMTFYDEGSYPPYFVKYSKEQGPPYLEEKKEEEYD